MSVYKEQQKGYNKKLKDRQHDKHYFLDLETGKCCETPRVQKGIKENRIYKKKVKNWHSMSERLIEEEHDE
jgi:hypothetical protein